MEHLNKGRVCITSDEERQQLATLNLHIATKARRSGAFNFVCNHCEIGLSLLGEEGWHRHPALMHQLQLGLAEAQSLIGNFSGAEHAFTRAFEHCSQDHERIECQLLYMQHLQQQARNLDAIQLQRGALAHLGILLPEDETQMQQMLATTMDQVESAARGITPHLLALREMSDSRDLAGMRFLFGLWFASYVAGQPTLCALAAAKMMSFSIENGTCDFTPMAMTNFAFLEIMLRNNHTLAAQFGEQAVQLADSRPHPVTRANTHAMYAALVAHWTKPLSISLHHFDEAFQWGIEGGDLVIAGNVIPMRAADQFISGQNLAELLNHTEQQLAHFNTTGQQDMADITLAGILQPVRCLMGMTKDCSLFDDDQFSEQAFQTQYAENPLVLAYFWHAKIRNAYFFDTLDAEHWAGLHDQVSLYIPGQAKGAEAAFYGTMILLRALERNPHSPNDSRLTELHAKIDTQNQWAQHCPENYAAKAALLNAEWLKLQGDATACVTAYTYAIDTAEKYGLLPLQALAYERFAQFWRDNKNLRLAHPLVKQAIALYQQWGACKKVSHLHSCYEFNAASNRRQSESSFAMGDQNVSIVLEAFLQASHALASEVGLRRVQERLMSIVKNEAGAQNSRLMLFHDHQWWIEAEVNDDERHVLLSQPIDIDAEKSRRLPLKVLRYVIRTGEAVVAHDITRVSRFADDPYIKAVRPKSVLCSPLRIAGQLLGLLYLENNQVSGAFTDARTNLLRALSEHLLIAIDNARLHDELERQVEERTRQLTHANKQLEELSLTDGLTGIPNRRYFEAVFQREFARCKREELPIGLALIDVDHFKAYNDHLGHMAGDDCLRTVAQALQRELRRDTDLIARYGGEEFVVMMPELCLERACQEAERLKQSVLNLNIPHPYCVDRQLTISIGLHYMAKTTDSIELLLQHADQALYAAKKAGRNQVAMSKQIKPDMEKIQ